MTHAPWHSRPSGGGTFTGAHPDFTPKPDRPYKPGRPLRKDPGEDVRRGFVGDLAQMGGDLKELPPVQDARNMWRDLSKPVKELGIVKDARNMYGDLIRDPIKKGLAGLKLPSWMMMDHVSQNLVQNAENERILGDDLYTDELRKTMVPNWDVSRGDPGYEGSRRQYHDKYKRLAEGTDDADKKQYYLDQARSAYRNANVTKRVNYALGDLGFDTSAEAGKAAFGETPTEFKGRIDYSTLPGNLQRGLEGTDAGEAFLRKHAISKEGDTPEITKTIENFNVGLRPDKYRDTPYVPPMTPKNTPIYGMPEELFIDELQNFSGGVNPNDAGYDFATAGNIEGSLYGLPGKSYDMNLENYLSSNSPYSTGTTSPLYGIYPNYTPNPIFDELEDMDELELLDWGILNPNEAEVFGFNPNYVTDSWID